MGEIMREAQFSLAEANFAAGDFRSGLVFFSILKYPNAFSHRQVPLIFL